MNNFTSFHGDPGVKIKYVERVKAHAAADQLIRGAGWENGKGCAVGCTLEAYDHSRYPIELGIPEWVAFLEDTVFEGSSKKFAMTWPVRLLEAVPVGMTEAQWESVRHAIAIKRLLKLSATQKAAIGDKWGVVAAIEQTIAYHRNPTESARLAARSAAFSAAESVAVSAERSARSARSAARSAAWSGAESAQLAVETAARLAKESAARLAAKSAAWAAAEWATIKELGVSAELRAAMLNQADARERRE